MTEQLFTTLSAALNTADSLTFMVSAESDGRLRVVLTPNMDSTTEPENKDGELRAALALPLVIREKPEVLDNTFISTLRDYATKRASLSHSLSVLDSLNDATNKASKKVVSAQNKSGKNDDSKSPAAGQATLQKKTPSVAASDNDILL